MNDLNLLKDDLIKEVKKRIFEENIPRIKKCLNLLSEEEVWYKPNANTPSVGNYILHLCGNARQWIIATLGRQKDIRNRSEEFSPSAFPTKDELIGHLDELEKEMILVLNQITPEHLNTIQSVQCFRESGLSILIHVVEHFSYHTGQITYFTKSRKNLATNYYSGLNLDEK